MESDDRESLNNENKKVFIMKNFVILSFIVSFLLDGCTKTNKLENAGQSTKDNVMEYSNDNDYNKIKVSSQDCYFIHRAQIPAVQEMNGLLKMQATGIAVGKDMMGEDKNGYDNTIDFVAYFMSRFMAKDGYDAKDLELCMNNYPEVMYSNTTRKQRIFLDSLYQKIINHDYPTKFDNSGVELIEQTDLSN